MRPDDPVSAGFEATGLLAHLTDLRAGLLRVFAFFLVAFAVCYALAEPLFSFLAAPLSDLLAGDSGRRLIYTHLTEAFTTYLKVAIFGAAFLSLPLAAIEVWRFLAPGLYANEKKAFLPFVVATPLFFCLGAVFAYTMIIPAAWRFFLSFETALGPHQLPIQLEARVGDYLSLVMQLLFAFGLCFLLPVLLVLLGRLGIVGSHHLSACRRYGFLGILVLSALVTPPDVMSMIGLALPIALLYEISIIVLKWMEKRQKKVPFSVPFSEPVEGSIKREPTHKITMNPKDVP